MWLLSAWLFVLGAGVDHRIRLRAPASMAAAVYGIARYQNLAGCLRALERRTSGRVAGDPPKNGGFKRISGRLIGGWLRRPVARVWLCVGLLSATPAADSFLQCSGGPGSTRRFLLYGWFSPAMPG